MHSGASRKLLTEGQVFRAHLRTYSAINQLFGLRPGLPTRDCDRDTPTLELPADQETLAGGGAESPPTEPPATQ